jgi:hypothetical protein
MFACLNDLRHFFRGGRRLIRLLRRITRSRFARGGWMRPPRD